MFFSKPVKMSRTICSDKTEILKKSKGKKSKYYCNRCGEKVFKEKWVCKPKKI
jgi:hypothetical protein